MDALTIAAIGMQNDIARMDGISQNLANVTTPGYKRQIPVARSFGNYMGELNAGVATVVDLTALSQPMLVDHSAGTLKYTGTPLDVAIEGAGFLEVSTNSGPLYTRQGALKIDVDGRLVTHQGMPVMGQGGVVTVTGTKASILPNGEIRDGENLFGQLRVVRFSNPEALIPLGGGMFAQGGAVMANDAELPRVRSGYQENSNVNSAHEMVRMNETMRHFESMQKIVQGYDEMMGNALRKLGEF